MISGLGCCFRTLVLIAAGVFVQVLIPIPTVRSAPFAPNRGMCANTPNLGRWETLNRLVAEADFAVVARCASTEKKTSTCRGSTKYQIETIIKGADALGKNPKPLSSGYIECNPGDWFVILGVRSDQGKEIAWYEFLEASEATSQYLARSPGRTIAPTQRLSYFLNYLESADPIVADDAFAEFANADYKDFELLAPKLPAEKIRGWIADPKTRTSRLGLYGMLLGLCGNPDDAQTLEARIWNRLPSDNLFYNGMDGLMAGYLLILKDKGLDVIDKNTLSNKNVGFNEAHSAMHALSFMWRYGRGKISATRLRKSMYLLLDNPEMVDLAIRDLADWKDWSIQDKLMVTYGQEAENFPAIKRAIVRYIILSTRDGNADGVPQAVHVTKGLKILEQMRKTDPKMVTEVERFVVAP